MGQRVRILTDAVADLPEQYVERYGIKVLPVYLVLNGKTYLDDGRLDRDWFYRELSEVTSRPSTAAPAPEEFLAAYSELASEGAEEIIALVASSTISSLHDHASLAASRCEGARVHVIDTMQVSMGIGWMALEAARLLEEDMPVSQVLDTVRAMRPRTHIAGVLDSIDYLRRSGRVNWVASHMISLLRIRPLIGFERGEARLLGKVRTYWRGARSVIERVREAPTPRLLAILHSCADPETLERFRGELSTLMPDLTIPVVDIGGVFATHVGPRCLGVAWVTAE